MAKHSFQPTLRQIYAGFLLGVLCILTFTVIGSSREVRQEKKGANIKFSHRFHVKDAGVACVDCHPAAATSKSANDNLFAAHEQCKSCHEEQLNSKCTFCHTSDDPSTYSASVVSTRNLVFSHQSHVSERNVECQQCHAGVDKAEIGVPMEVPGMPTCTTCHNDVKATSTCETCHVDLAGLRPRDHNRTDFVHEHKIIARSSTATCATCHTQESCADCHNGSDLLKGDKTGRDLGSPLSPRISAMDRGQGIKLTKVHDLNFKFTHGVAASQKGTECQTCHDQQTFCATCHTAGGNINEAKFLPKSHQQAGFITFGVGSGGGLHSKLAKRDIENCAACHDTQGADPACIQCHMDPDGIRGTNPRTHDPGFMSDNHGIWHTDPGASCYVCHTDANARVGGVKGQKFCGYCHK